MLTQHKMIMMDGSENAALALLRGATLWLDARKSVAAEQSATNMGTGGSALDARYGSTTGADTNDPLLLTHTGTNYVYLPGVAGNYLSVPDEAALDITGDIELVRRMSLDDWTPSAQTTVVGKQSGGSTVSWRFDIGTSGSFILTTSPDGTATNFGTTAAFTTLVNGTAYWVKATRVSATGVCEFFYAADQETEPVSWTQIPTTANSTAGASFSSTSPVEIGSRNTGAQAGVAGTNYRTIIRDGIGGSTVLDINCATDITSSAATTFTATSGQTVTVNRATSGRKTCLVTRPVWLFGTDDYLEIADNALLDFANSQPATVVLIARVFGTTNLYLLSKGTVDSGTAGTSGGYVLRTVAGAHYVQTQSEAVSGTRVNSSLATVSGALTTRTAVFDGAGTVTAWNGNTSAAASTALDGTTMANSAALRVGGQFSYGDFECLAVLVFRQALTADEIALINTYFGTA